VARVITRAPKRQKQWSQIPSIALALTADGTSLGGGNSFSEKATVLRIRGHLIIQATAGTTYVASDAVQIGFGIAKVSTDAFTAGAGSVPDPLGDEDYPWLYWGSRTWTSQQVSVIAEAGPQYHFVDVDTKAMRIVAPKETICWVLQYADIAGTPPVDVLVGNARMLRALS